MILDRNVTFAIGPCPDSMTYLRSRHGDPCPDSITYLRSRHGDPCPDSITKSRPFTRASLMSCEMTATRFVRTVSSLYVTSFRTGRELAHRMTFNKQSQDDLQQTITG